MLSFCSPNNINFDNQNPQSSNQLPEYTSGKHFMNEFHAFGETERHFDMEAGSPISDLDHDGLNYRSMHSLSMSSMKPKRHIQNHYSFTDTDYEYDSTTASPTPKHSLSLNSAFQALSPRMSFTENKSPVNVAKLFVGGLSHETNDNSLRKYFERFGPVKEAMVLRDNFTMNSRGFGFVTFTDVHFAQQVVIFSRTQDHVVDGKKVEVKFAVPREGKGNASFSPRLQNRGIDKSKRNSLKRNDSESRNSVSSHNSQTTCDNEVALNMSGINIGHQSPLASIHRVNSLNIQPHIKNEMFRSQSFGTNFIGGMEGSSPVTEPERNPYRASICQGKTSPVSNQCQNSSSTYEENIIVPNKIFVGGLLYATGHESLKKYFEKFGQIESAEVIYNRETKKSRGFGFVVYKDFQSVEAVLHSQKVDRLMVDGKQIEVKLCKAREDAVAEFLGFGPGQVSNCFIPNINGNPGRNMQSHSRSSSFGALPMTHQVCNRGLETFDMNLSQVRRLASVNLLDDGVGQPKSPLAQLNKNSAVFQPISSMRDDMRNDYAEWPNQQPSEKLFGAGIIGEKVLMQGNRDFASGKTRSLSENEQCKFHALLSENPQRRQTFVEHSDVFANKHGEFNFLPLILEEK